jgi:hypothetical protein
MMKWTQEQREVAAREMVDIYYGKPREDEAITDPNGVIRKIREAYMLESFDWSANPNGSITVSRGLELLCQRNALLDALKDITNLACGWQGSYEWRMQVTRRATEAIAKAESK